MRRRRPECTAGRGGRPVSDEQLQAQREATTLDRVHAAMLLQRAGRTQALRALLAAEQDRGPDFLRLANALSALYPRDAEEKRLLDAMLLAVPQGNRTYRKETCHDHRDRRPQRPKPTCLRSHDQEGGRTAQERQTRAPCHRVRSQEGQARRSGTHARYPGWVQLAAVHRERRRRDRSNPRTPAQEWQLLSVTGGVRSTATSVTNIASITITYDAD